MKKKGSKDKLFVRTVCQYLVKQVAFVSQILTSLSRLGVQALPGERSNSPRRKSGLSTVASVTCSCENVESLGMEDSLRCIASCGVG
jgi:hypothetical protein